MFTIFKDCNDMSLATASMTKNANAPSLQQHRPWPPVNNAPAIAPQLAALNMGVPWMANSVDKLSLV
jgi:hypothetical protein